MSDRKKRADSRRSKRKEKQRQREIDRAQRIAERWGEPPLAVVFVTPMERLGPSTFYCPDCGIVELVPQNEDEAPCDGAPSETNWLGVRRGHHHS